LKESYFSSEVGIEQAFKNILIEEIDQIDVSNLEALKNNAD